MEKIRHFFMFKKCAVYIALVPLVILALTPPWSFTLSCAVNSLAWLWVVILSGFLAFLFAYTNTSPWLKLFLIWSYFSCFISSAPYISFTAYWSVIACAYYYLLCLQIEDFSPVLKSIQMIFFLMGFLIMTQLFHLDTLLNFNMPAPCVLGTIGNAMILGTYTCVLAPFLIFWSWNWFPLLIIVYIAQSAGAIMAILAGLGTILCFRHKWGRYICVFLIIAGLAFAWHVGKFKVLGSSGRLPIWKRTVKLTLQHPWGYGPATYRLLFPLYSKDLEASQATLEDEWEYDNTRGPGLAWRRAHNDFLQIPFEVGIPGAILFFGWIFSIIGKVKDPLKIAGLVILGIVMVPHFPMRMMQCVLILLMYLAFVERNPGATKRRRG